MHVRRHLSLRSSTAIDTNVAPSIDGRQCFEDAILAAVDPRDSADELERTIERYNDAWNAQDVETIVSLHAPGMVFENHTAGDRVEGDAVGAAHRGHLRA